jgi:type III secretion protein R
MTTCYTKIVVILGLLRQALGVQQVPPNMVLNSLALILTVYVMAPIGMDIGQAVSTQLIGRSANAPQPSPQQQVDDIMGLYKTVAQSMRGFLLKHSKERDRKFFLQSAARLWPAQHAKDLKEDDLLVLIPSFTIGELTEAFRVGFVLFLSFVIVDMIVGNILLAMGMSMISPTVVSTPFKLLLFVSLDGWSRLAQGLVLGYQ